MLFRPPSLKFDRVGSKNRSNFTNLISLSLSGCESLNNVNGLTNLINISSLSLLGCKSLNNIEARALVYQSILLSENVETKIRLIFLLFIFKIKKTVTLFI